MKQFGSLAILWLMATAAFAQLPTDAEIKQKVGGGLANVKSFKFTGRPAFERYNKTNQVTEWCKELIMVRAADDIKTMDMEYKGLAIYEKRAGTYNFYKFTPYQRKYIGQPQITFEEVQAIIAKDWPSFYGHYFNKIVKLEKAPGWVDEPYIRWHNISSVEVFLKATFEYISSDIETERKVQVFSVRLYRDDLGKPWKRFYAQTLDYDENEVLETKKYTPQQINKMSQKTLGFILSEKAASQTVASGPSIQMPAFKSLMDITVYLHNILRNGKPGELKAALMQVLAPEHFITGSKVLLNPKGEALVNEAIEKAFNGEGTYSMQYCQNAGVDKARTTAQRVYVLGCINNVVTMTAGAEVNAGYLDGKPQKSWKLTELSIGTRQDQDALDYIASFSSRAKLCKND